MILLDTHALIWWVNDESLLPLGVKRKIRQAQKVGDLNVSAMSFWEIAMLHKKGRLSLTHDIHSWLKKVEAIPSLDIVPVHHDILVHSVLLPDVFHADPADRIIVATALNIGATLITKDEKISNSKLVKSYWN